MIRLFYHIMSRYVLRVPFQLVVLAFLCLSCKTRYVPVETVITETVEVHDTTVQEKLVPYKDSVSVKDTVSFLSNPYAYSKAEWSGGMLRHTLGIWPNAVLIVEIPKYMVRTRTVEVPKVVEVEKKLNRWQQMKVDYGGWFLLANVIAIGLLISKWLKKRGGR